MSGAERVKGIVEVVECKGQSAKGKVAVAERKSKV